MQKTINIGNYEAYLLDYLEGALDPSLRMEMEAFLKEHPEIAAETEGVLDVRLEEEEVIYPDAASLYQAKAALREEEAMELFSAAADGTLDDEGLQELEEALLEYPALEKDYKVYMATRLVADMDIVFPDKQVLKRSIPLYAQPIVRNVARIAAVLIILMLSFWYFTGTDSSDFPGLTGMQQIAAADEQPGLPAPVANNVPATDEAISGQKGTDRAVGENQKLLPVHGLAKGNRVEKRNKQSNNSETEGQEDLRQALARLEPVGQDVQVLNIREHFREEYSLRERISYVSLMWLTGDPLYAGAREDENTIRTNLSWLIGGGSDDAAGPRQADRNGISLWPVADAGVAAINALTDNNIRLQRDLDDDGNVIAYTLVSDRFEIARKRRLE